MSDNQPEILPTTEELLKKCYVSSAERVGGYLTDEEKIRVHNILGAVAATGPHAYVVLKRADPPENRLRISIIETNQPGTAARLAPLAE